MRLSFDPDTHTYTIGDERLPSVTQVIDRVGLIPSSQKNSDAAHRGKMVHLAARYLFEHRLDWSSVASPIAGYVCSLDKWISATGFSARECEGRGWHRVHRYAGQWDVVGKMEYGEVLIDIKTGAPAKWHGLQTAAYVEITGRALKRGSLYLQQDGSIAKFVAHKDEADFARFLACLTVYRMLEES